MRIVHVTTFLQGGAGRIITALAIAQQRAGHAVTVVADAGSHTEYQTYPEYVAQLLAAGVRYLTVRSTFARDAAEHAAASRDLGAALRTAPDLLHAHAAVPVVVARAAAPGVPIVQTMHGWGIRKTAAQAAHDCEVMSRVDALVTPSHAARTMLAALGVARPIDVIAYGIADGTGEDVDARDRVWFQRATQEGTPIAMCIGTIGTRKNQQLLVDALGDAHAVFVGDGDRDSLEAYARQGHAAERVHILGYRRDASRYLRYATALVLPSRNEGLPIAVLEAFRAGVPVIASDLPEMREVITHQETGLLFAPESAASLRRALARVARMPAAERRSMAAATRSRFDASYREQMMVARYEEIYRRVSAAAVANRTCSVAVQHAS